MHSYCNRKYLSRLAQLARNAQRSRSLLPLAFASAIIAVGVRGIVVAPDFFIPALGSIPGRIITPRGAVVVGGHDSRGCGTKGTERAGGSGFYCFCSPSSTPHTCAKSSGACCNWTPDMPKKTLSTTRATQTDADSAWADYHSTEHVISGGRW